MTEQATTGLPAEWGHWYHADGSPAYEIKAKAGHMRPVTLRDARKLDLFPSVTGIIKCAAAPALEAWKVRQGILAALTLPRIPGETEDIFADRVLEDSKRQARDAAILGSVIHEQLQRAFDGQPEPEYWPFVNPVRQWLRDTFPGVEWSSERSFASSLGFGGKVDLFSRQRPIVLDFKTKDFDQAGAEKIKGYDEQGMQLAAYAVGLGLDGDPRAPAPERVNLFVSTKVPGLLVPIVWPPETFGRHWAMFEALLTYWQADKKYRPGGAA